MKNPKVATSIDQTTYKHNKHRLAHKHEMDLFRETTDTATKKMYVVSQHYARNYDYEMINKTYPSLQQF